MGSKKKITAEYNSTFFNVSVIVFVLYVILYFFKLGGIGLIDVDEPRYAEAGREILESSNWIVPHFNYAIRYDKPIFFYWLEAISMKLFGVNEFAARFPSVITSFLCVGVLFYVLKNFYDLLTALLGSLILMSCFEFVALSRFSVTDMTLCSFVSSSLLCFFSGYRYLLTSHRFVKSRLAEFSIWYILAFIFLACAFLTKGPVAVLLIGLILLPFFWWIGKLDYLFKSSSFYIGCVVFLIVVLPWYIAVHFETGGEFTKVFFGLHNFSRYTQVVSGHKGSILYFIPVVLLGFIPWVFFLPQAINAVVNRGLRSLLTSPEKQFPWFCLWWFLITFVFFSFSKTKLLTYILPVFPALSVLVALWFREYFNKRDSMKGLVIGLGVFFVFTLVILYICLFNLNIILPREVKDLKLDFQIISFAFLLFVGVSMAWASSNKDIGMTITILLSTFVLFYFCLVGFVMPKIDKHSQYMLRTFAKSIPMDTEISTYQIIKPSLTFYAKRKIYKIDSLDRLQEKLNREDKVAFVTKRKLLDGVMLDNFYQWGKDSRYIFFTNYPVKL